MFQPKVIFRKLPKGRLAESDTIRDIIAIDGEKRQDVIRTYVHEVVHLVFPLMSETRVRKAESALYKLLSGDDKLLILLEIFKEVEK